MRTYKPKMDKYGITNNMYLELLYFCRQYDHKRQMAQYERGLSAPAVSGGGSYHSDPTASRASRAERFQRDVDLIDKAAIEAAEDLAPFLILNVTRGKTFRELNVPCSHGTFSNKRRKFFHVLAELRGML